MLRAAQIRGRPHVGQAVGSYSLWLLSVAAPMRTHHDSRNPTSITNNIGNLFEGNSFKKHGILAGLCIGIFGVRDAL